MRTLVTLVCDDPALQADLPPILLLLVGVSPVSVAIADAMRAVGTPALGALLREDGPGEGGAQRGPQRQSPVGAARGLRSRRGEGRRRRRCSRRFFGRRFKAPFEAPSVTSAPRGMRRISALASQGTCSLHDAEPLGPPYMTRRCKAPHCGATWERCSGAPLEVPLRCAAPGRRPPRRSRHRSRRRCAAPLEAPFWALTPFQSTSLSRHRWCHLRLRCRPHRLADAHRAL